MELIYPKSPYLSKVQCVDSAVTLETAGFYNLCFLTKKKKSNFSLPFLKFTVCPKLQLSPDVITV